MKRCSFAVRELWLITTMGYNYISIRKVKIQNTDNANWWPGAKTRGIYTLLVGMQNDVVSLEDSLAVSYKTKPRILMLSVITLLSIYPTNLKTYITQKSACECL